MRMRSTLPAAFYFIFAFLAALSFLQRKGIKLLPLILTDSLIMSIYVTVLEIFIFYFIFITLLEVSI